MRRERRTPEMTQICPSTEAGGVNHGARARSTRPRAGSEHARPGPRPSLSAVSYGETVDCHGEDREEARSALAGLFFRLAEPARKDGIWRSKVHTGLRGNKGSEPVALWAAKSGKVILISVPPDATPDFASLAERLSYNDGER
ncbi:hypothetical protein AAFF_G00244530 [Aldrovandia affinis]|uniref:Uncharacterized protein n=1 Tax=Aldrovandia affinis TaxID=143900 RepID=A0AAD7RDF8_9TELE|nr:hypothetical protein AAFF_G00244530 [Aldrovandia affinis]